jgi:hypothetical protein
MPKSRYWSYVTVVMRSHEGICTESQLWRHKKTGYLIWCLI